MTITPDGPRIMCAGDPCGNRRYGRLAPTIRARRSWFVGLDFTFLLLTFVILVPAGVRAAEPKTIELFEYNGRSPLNALPPDMHPVILEVPGTFLYDSSIAASRAWAVQILTYYPSFSSPTALENKNNGLDCIGDCNGRILISVEYRPSIANSSSPNMGDYIARAQLKAWKTPPYPSNVVVHDLSAQDGFDEGFERITTASANVRGVESSPGASIEKAFFRKTRDGEHYDLAATCRKALVRTGCILHFSLSCNPAIYASVNGLDIAYLGKSADIEKKANSFISEMIKNPPCDE